MSCHLRVACQQKLVAADQEEYLLCPVQEHMFCTLLHKDKMSGVVNHTFAAICAANFRRGAQRCT